MTTNVIAIRIKQIITNIVDHSHTGFIKSRYIGKNIRLLFEITGNAEEETKPGLIFFSDHEKAFDSLDHMFLINCLKRLNFGKTFNGWINLFYNDAKRMMATCQISFQLNVESAKLSTFTVSLYY